MRLDTNVIYVEILCLSIGCCLQGSDAIEGIVLNLSNSGLCIGSSTFTRMKILRILKLYYGCQDGSGVHFEQNHMVRKDSNMLYSGSPEYLSSELRLLCWHGYPFEFLPSTFSPESLVTLDMSYSHIKELWSGTKVCMLFNHYYTLIFFIHNNSGKSNSFILGSSV